MLTLLFSGGLLQAQQPGEVLYTTQSDAGDHKIIFQRIVPPAAPAAVPASAATASPSVDISSLPRPQVLALSATVYDNGLTDLRWRHEGQDYRIWSSINFHHLRSIGTFTAGGLHWTLILSIGDETAQRTAARAEVLRAQGVAEADLPRVPALPPPPVPGRSYYQTITAPAHAPEAAFAGIDALHRHYDAHAAALQQTYAVSEAARAQRAAWLQAHPPQKQDTIIRFWPVKSALHLPQGGTVPDKEAAP